MNKQEQRAARLLAHYANLSALAVQTGGKVTDGKKISLALLKAEHAAHIAAEHWCNGDIEEEEFDAVANRVTGQVYVIFPNLKGFFVNSDPRGYALKIKTEVMQELNYPLHKDWGGYGILSPEIQ